MSVWLTRERPQDSGIRPERRGATKLTDGDVYYGLRSARCFSRFLLHSAWMNRSHSQEVAQELTVVRLRDRARVHRLRLGRRRSLADDDAFKELVDVTTERQHKAHDAQSDRVSLELRCAMATGERALRLGPALPPLDLHIHFTYVT